MIARVDLLAAPEGAKANAAVSERQCQRVLHFWVRFVAETCDERVRNLDGLPVPPEHAESPGLVAERESKLPPNA